MAAQNKSGSEDAISDINIVPLVDIILVVLIIFMVTVPTAMKPAMDLNLPEAANGESKDSSPLNFFLTQEGQLYFNTTEIALDEIPQISKEELAKNQEAVAVVTADKNIPYGHVIEVIDKIKESGIKTLSVSTEEKP